MRTEFSLYFSQTCSFSIYEKLRNFSKHSPNIGRLGCLPVAFADVSLSLLSAPCSIIESIALVIINLVGSLSCSKYYTIRDAILCLEFALIHTVALVVHAVIVPLVFIYQFFHILAKPTEARPITHDFIHMQEWLRGEVKEAIIPNDGFHPPQQQE